MQISWADRMGIPRGVMGQVIGGVVIDEKNRATTYEFRKEGIEELIKIRDKNYRAKNVDAVLFGVEDCTEDTKYAVFVESGFLVNIAEDD